MNFNINKVICINLKSHDSSGLRIISEVYKISYDALLRTKLRGTHKIWIEPGGDYAIAAIETSNPDDFYICERFCPLSKKEREAVKNIKPIKTPKLKSQSNITKVVKSASDVYKVNQKELELDDILDKINDLGLSSLTKEELNFLKKFK